MLAEIFMLRLESLARTTPTNGSTAPVSDTRFVPITLPRRWFPRGRWAAAIAALSQA